MVQDMANCESDCSEFANSQVAEWEHSGPELDCRAATTGRTLIDRPPVASNDLDHAVDHPRPFTASAADTPLALESVNPASLRSCLSSSGIYSGSPDRTGAPRANRVVSFYLRRVREYEVTFGDDSSNSPDAPLSLSLGWGYNPEEKISSLGINDETAQSTKRKTNAEAIVFQSCRLNFVLMFQDV
mmetsp:Transcript_9549/g.20739  ORF Transcript_9549/g.20739 Transcript_9549/m.20739 type:complete len:186 (-) Transcript_9549:78-635(-)